jgi:hypothetical protein
VVRSGVVERRRQRRADTEQTGEGGVVFAVVVCTCGVWCKWWLCEL